jgi:hypothetical protein
MKVKELIEQLGKFDPEMGVRIIVSCYQGCCSQEYCYCSSEDTEFQCLYVAPSTLYDKKLKKHVPQYITIRGQQ